MDKSQRKGKFDSVLGIVEFEDAKLDLPKLITPANGMSFMFSRVDENVIPPE